MVLTILFYRLTEKRLQKASASVHGSDGGIPFIERGFLEQNGHPKTFSEKLGEEPNHACEHS